LLDSWVAAGVISKDQAARIREVADARLVDVAPAGSLPGPRRSPLVLEAVAYVGGAIVAAGSMLFAAHFWSDLGTAWRLALLAVVAVAFLVAGTLIPDRLGAVGERLHSALWLVSTGGLAGLLAVGADGLDLEARDQLLVVSAGTTAYATSLWFSRRIALQHATMMVALALTASAAIARADLSDNLPGIGAWAIGLVWLLLGWCEALGPRWLALMAGASVAVFGAMTTAGADAGMVLTLLTVGAVVAVAVLMREVALLIVGVLATLVNVPAAMARWFPDSVSAALGLVVIGFALVVLAVRIARGLRGEPAPGRRDWSTISRRVAGAAIAGVLLITSATVVVAWV
jgi:predicted membrane protein DUF2157